MGAIIENPKARGILIVDDEPNVCEMLREVLEGVGYNHVLTADNGIEALSLLSSQSELIYLILLDIMMPELDGIGVVKHIANVHPYHVGVVIITGHGSMNACVSFYKASSEKVMALDFISKPLHIDKLKSEVEAALETVHQKRKGHIELAGSEVHKRFDWIEARLSSIDDKISAISEIRKDVKAVTKKLPTFVEQLGMDILRAILIALAFVALMYFGVGNFLLQLIEK